MPVTSCRNKVWEALILENKSKQSGENHFHFSGADGSRSTPSHGKNSYLPASGHNRLYMGPDGGSYSVLGIPAYKSTLAHGFVSEYHNFIPILVHHGLASVTTSNYSPFSWL